MANGKIVTVYPVMVGNGGKYMATSIAYSYKQRNHDTKVALVDFDFKNPFLAASLTTHDNVHGVDNLIERINTGFLTNELFMDNMVPVKGLFDVLKGTMLPERSNLITKNQIDTIIDYLKKNYDVIVIAVSPYSDNAGTVYGLYNADEVVMVVRENIANYKRFRHAITTVKNLFPTEKKIKLVYNMRIQEPAFDFNDVAVEAGLETIAGIPYDEGTLDNRNISAGLGGRITNKFAVKYNEMMKKVVDALQEDDEGKKPGKKPKGKKE